MVFTGQTCSVEVAPTAEDIVSQWSYLRVNPVTAGLVSHSKKCRACGFPLSA